MIYNKEEKFKFLEEAKCSEAVAKGYYMIFRNIFETETSLNKDLRFFNYEELLLALEQLKGRSYNSVHTKWGLVKKYLKFYKNECYNSVTSADINKFVFESEVRYTTRQELHEKTACLPNASHKLLLFLLFDGVMGKSYSDIINLKYSDVDFERCQIDINGTLHEVSKDTINLILETQKETSLSKLSIKDNDGIVLEEYDLNPNSPYIFKTRVMKKTENGMLPYKETGLKTRLGILTKMIGLENVNGKTLYYSGLIERYLKLEKKLKKRLTVADIKFFAQNVGVKTIQPVTLYKALKHFR